MYYVDIWQIELHHHPLYWNNIVYLHWQEIEYKLGTWRSSVLGMVKCKDSTLGTWRSSMENCLIYDSALKSFAQTREDRSCLYMDLASSRWVMNSRCNYDKYHVYIVERGLRILRHIISWHYIALHFITSFIFSDYVFYLVVGKYLIFDYLYLMKFD